MDLRRTVYSKEHSEMIEIIVLAFLDHHLVEKRLLVYENYARDCNRLFAFDENTVETAKFGRHFCSAFSAELCSFRTWKILQSSDDMDELLSSDHMNELCNYELKSSDICSELLSCQNQ